MVGGDYSSPGLVLRCPKYPSLKNGTEKTMRLAKLNRNIPFATNKNHLPPFRPFLIPLTLSRHLLTQSPILNSKPKTQSHSLVLLSLYSLLFLCRFVVSLFSFFSMFRTPFFCYCFLCSPRCCCCCRRQSTTVFNLMQRATC